MKNLFLILLLISLSASLNRSYAQTINFNTLLELRLKKILIVHNYLIGKGWKLTDINKNKPSETYKFTKENSDRNKEEFFIFDDYKGSVTKSGVHYTFLKEGYYRHLLLQCKNANFRILKPIKNSDEENNGFVVQYTFKGKGVVVEFYTIYLGRNKDIITYNISIMDEMFYPQYKNS